MRTHVMVGCLLLGACGGGRVVVETGGELIVGSCNAVATRGLCEEYRGPVSQPTIGSMQSRCQIHGGVFSAAPCPADGQWGSCVAIAPEETNREPGTSVFGAAYRADAVTIAQGQCVRGGGTWNAYR